LIPSGDSGLVYKLNQISRDDGESGFIQVQFNANCVESNVDVQGRFEMANKVANGNGVGMRTILIDLRKTIRFSNTKKDSDEDEFVYSVGIE